MIDNLTIEQARASLRTKVCDIKFVKKDGTERPMKATTNIEFVPVDKIPKSGEPKPNDKNPGLFHVFDVEMGEWRAFYFDKLVEFNETEEVIQYG
jgi:hypothetical protein